MRHPFLCLPVSHTPPSVSLPCPQQATRLTSTRTSPRAPSSPPQVPPLPSSLPLYHCLSYSTLCTLFYLPDAMLSFPVHQQQATPRTSTRTSPRAPSSPRTRRTLSLMFHPLYLILPSPPITVSHTLYMLSFPIHQQQATPRTSTLTSPRVPSSTLFTLCYPPDHCLSYSTLCTLFYPPDHCI